MFYFREKELTRLSRFAQGDAKAMAIYGRRRTGKTRLITRFEQERTNCVYYQCTSQNYSVCLQDFAETIVKSFPQETAVTSMRSFRELFLYLSRILTESQIFIIDEFPFLAKRNEDVVTEFQWIIDHGLGGHKLILLGSNISFMRRQLFDRESPLYGRFDEMMEILPFSFSELRQLFPDFEDTVSVYAQTGGVAQYVMFFLKYPSVKEASEDLFFDPDGRLLQEAGNLLMQELREITVYSSVLRAIGRGEKTSAQIAKKAGMEAKTVPSYLSRLTDLGIVSQVENPLSAKKNDSRYAISDMLFRFHYSFVEPNMSLISAVGSKAMAVILRDEYQEYLGGVYEQIIRSNCFAYGLNGRLAFVPLKVGKWWGNVCTEGVWSESEVDVLAYDNQHLVVGECKYRTKQMGLKELDQLKMKAAFIPSGGRKIAYLLASRGGFTEDLLTLHDPQVILIDRE